MEALKQLQTMHGYSYLFAGNEITIRDHVLQSGGEVVIRLVDKEPIVLPIKSVATKLKEFMPIGRGVQTTNSDIKELKNIADSSNFEALEKVLMENINKVRTDKNYIPQAKEINSQASTLLKITKQKISMVTELRKLKSL